MLFSSYSLTRRRGSLAPTLIVLLHFGSLYITPRILLARLVRCLNLVSSMSGAWGSRVSLAQRLAAQPAPPPPQPRLRQIDGSISAPVALSLTDNLTVVVSLILLSSDLSHIALLSATSDSTSDRAADGFHTPSELLLDEETLEDVASLLHMRITGQPADNSMVRVACVEHYPTLRQQWLRYTCIAMSDTVDPARIVDGARWFPLTDVMEGGVKLATAGDLVRVLHSVTEAHTHERPNSIPLAPTLSTSRQQLPASPPLCHLAVTLLFTIGRRILLCSSQPHQLPSTHCDKGETLTFTAHRFARALLGLTQSHPTILALYHQSHAAKHAVNVVCHVAVDSAAVVEREANETCSELVECGEETERALRSYMRLRWYSHNEVDQQRRAGETDAFTYGCCQLAFARMLAMDRTGLVRVDLGVPALHVETAEQQQQQQPAAHSQTT